MGGGYISCGDFFGEDKSGSAFEGVLRLIPRILPPDEAARFTEKVAAPLLRALQESAEQFEISPETVGYLFEPLARYYGADRGKDYTKNSSTLTPTLSHRMGEGEHSAAL